MPEQNARPDIAKRLRPIEIQSEMKDSYLRYSMSVIVSRALPLVGDGLKPSQRRILYSMHELNIGPTVPHRKSAAVVGHAQGKYHPHGEQAIYPTLVRMAQPFNSRYPLVDGHGNFGSVDGDPPAAMRYTEARLTELGMEMMADIEKDTVDFVPNYDGSEQEPVILPSRFPNLICNGSAGIAVGMATDIPPHNLSEVVDALVMLIDNEQATVEDLMTVLPGPDFPTGAMILGTKGIREAYSTGRGQIMMQARAVIEPMEGNRAAIVITELPYQVNKANLVESIAGLVRDRKLDGISGLRDETDRSGMRVVIELKREANPHVVLNYLYKHTALRTSYSIILLALVDGQPRTLDLAGVLRNFITHRQVVITRRTRFELEKARERAHILEGYRIALRNLDEVIQLIKDSRSPAVAKVNLMERFSLSDRQAQAILELMLQRLTNMEQQKIQEEYNQIIKQIAYLEDILANPRKVLGLIKDELVALKRKYGDERRTRIREEEAANISIEDLIAEEDNIITVTRDGYIKRLPVDTYRIQGRGGKGVIALTHKEEDTVEHLFVANTHSYIMFFTNRGKVYRLRAHEVPAASRQARGSAIINLIQIEPGERITATRTVKEFSDKQYLFMGTRKGVVKKTALSAFDTPRKGGILAINLDDDDELNWVKVTDGEQQVIMATRNGMAIRFPAAPGRPMGRAAAGVIGIRLRPGDEVIGMEVCSESCDLLVATEKGYGKRTLITAYRPQARGGYGLKTLNITDKNGPLVDMKVVSEEDELLVITAEGHIIRQAVASISEVGRLTQGVRLIRLDEGDRVAGITKVVKHEDGDSAPEAEQADQPAL